MKKEIRYAYYQKINKSSFEKLIEALYDLQTDEWNKNIIEDIHRCRCKIEDAISDGHIEDVYLIVHYVKFPNPLFTCCELKITGFSIWKFHPNSYLTNFVNETSKYIEYYSDKFADLTIYSDRYGYVVKKLLNKLSENEDRLQKQESSGKGSESRCLIYGGGNRPQLTTGRHCNEARIKEVKSSIRGPQIIISSRCPKILRG